MATLIDDSNPSGIQFDDAGPGAGIVAPGVPKLDKIAAVAAKAKLTPATKAKTGPVVKAKPVTAAKVTSKPSAEKTRTVRHAIVTVERYKVTGVDDLIYDKGGVVLGMCTSNTQNACDFLVEFPA